MMTYQAAVLAATDEALTAVRTAIGALRANGL